MSNKIAPSVQLTVVIAAIAMLGVLDWVTGYELSFFVFYFIPIAFAAWYLGLFATVLAAVLSGMSWFFADLFAGHHYSAMLYEVWSATTRFASFITIGWAVSRMRQMLDRERQSAEMLRQALSEIKVLENFLPICAECKKIRDKDGDWQELEVYIAQHSNTQFSHGYCPECGKRALEEAGLKTAPESDGGSASGQP
jgi:K+-sensing histidine kinase KdpD